MPGKRASASEMIKFLTDFKFGVSSKGVMLSAERQARIQTALPPKLDQYVRELKSLTQEELEALYYTELNRKVAQERARAEAEEAERFFNQPYSNADFDHWSKMAYWTIEEAIALSLGKNPEYVDWKKIESYKQVSPLVRDYSKRRDLAKRAVAIKQLTDGVIPGFFLGWANRNELSTPEELVQLVEKRGQAIADWPTLLKNCQDEHSKTITWWSEKQKETLDWAKEQQSKALEVADNVMEKMSVQVKQRDDIIDDLNAEIAKLHEIANTPIREDLPPKSLQSLLKLILGMAIDGYGYDPKDRRSPIPKELADALSGKGISIDEDTVRKWLKKAGDEVDISTSNQPDNP
jgi:hypothetical protein